MAAVRGARPSRTVLGHPLHLGETGVDTDRTGARQAELDAVVPGRVVRRGEHRAGRVEAAGTEVHEVGGSQPEVDDVETVLEQAVGERRQQLRTRRAHVAGDDDPIARRPTSRRSANPTPSAWAISTLN